MTPLGSFNSVSHDLSDQATATFRNLSIQRGKVLADYIWIGSTGADLHSKTKVLDSRPAKVEQLPTWHFDGAATSQQTGSTALSTVVLRPRAMFCDPLRGDCHLLVLCDTHTPSFNPAGGSLDYAAHSTNNRVWCESVMSESAAHEPAFSVEQQYTLLDPATRWPLGWPQNAAVEHDHLRYCGVGRGTVVGREFAEAHIRCCLHAGLKVSGSSPQDTSGQWSYSLGPCSGLELGDQLWVSRYLLQRLTERHEVLSSIEPKPVPGDWSGNGAPVKYSTKGTREQGKGWSVIEQHSRLLQATHLQHLMFYGKGNVARLTGGRKTSSAHQFTVGLELRNASIRVPHTTIARQGGYYEDRRPASNMDPYLVTSCLVSSTLNVPLPGALRSQQNFSAESTASDNISRSSSAILDELAQGDSFAPDTPPQNMSLLAAECSGTDSMSHRR